MKTKLVIFDFDGTLSKPSKRDNSWAKIWSLIDREEDDNRLYDMYLKGELDYDKWAEEVIKVYREEGVSTKTLKKVAKDTSLLDNTKDVFKYFHDNDIKIIILSGGIKNIIEYVLKSNLKYVYKLEAQAFIFDENDIVQGVTKLDHFVEDKSQYVNRILTELKLSPNEVVFFGNDRNDEDVYKTGVKTVCLNPHHARYEDKTIWNETILRTTDLKSILSFINLN